MKVSDTGIEGLYVLEPVVYPDDRGYFFESYNKNDFDRSVAGTVFVQDNESMSSYGVIRGLHFQKDGYGQSKLVRAAAGRILDVAVDLRPGSPTFGKHFSVELSDANKKQLFIPKGFAHGFSVLSRTAVCIYKCDGFYAPGHEGSIRWNDPDLSIDWKIPEKDVMVSEKDGRAGSFREFENALKTGKLAL